MNNTFVKKIAPLAGAISCLLAIPASAQTLTITPTNSTVTGGVAMFTVAKGSTFTFLANLTTSGGALSLNNDNANFLTAPGPTEINSPTSSNTVALDDSVFFNTLPKTASGTANNVGLFAISIGTGATTGTYSGYFTIQGAPPPDTTSENDLATQPFTINVVAAPEPSSFIVEGLGVAVLGALIVAKRRRSNAF